MMRKVRGTYESHQESDSITLDEDLPPASTLRRLLFLPDSSLDLGKLSNDSRIIDGKLPEPSEMFHSLVFSMFGGEPSWGFLDDGQEEHHDSDGDNLKGDRDSPLDGSSGSWVFGHGIVDPDRSDI